MESLVDFEFDDLPNIEGTFSPESSEKENDVGDMPLGVFKEMSNDDYHSSSAISKSGLDQLRKSPAHLWYYQKQGSRRTRALDLGSLFHDLVLMPDDYFNLHYKLMPEFNLRTTAGRDDRDAWLNILASYQVPVTTADMELVEAMRDSILMHPEAGWLVREARASGECENSHFVIDEETFTYTRCRPDLKLMNHALLGDLKSTEDASQSAFENNMKLHRYHVQDAMYRHIVQQTDGIQIMDFWFIAVEKKVDRPVTAVYRLSPKDLQDGWEQYRADIQFYEEMLSNDSFTAPVEVSLPQYARKF